MVFILVLQYEFLLEQYLSYENISLLWFLWCFDFFLCYHVWNFFISVDFQIDGRSIISVIGALFIFGDNLLVGF